MAGGGDLRPALILGAEIGRRVSNTERARIALIGRVWCKVTAEHGGGIETGDLLTTSPVAGHAMRVADHQSGLGAILGKALRPLARGTAMIPILVA